MSRRAMQMVVLAAAAASGCATHGVTSGPRILGPASPATQPVATAANQRVVLIPTPVPHQSSVRMESPLETVPPRPVLRHPVEAGSEPSPPIEAVHDYAQAREALLDNERYTAINLLERAQSLDPNSYLINSELGKLYLGDSVSDERSIDAYERAAAIDPDHLDLQINLGRQYLAGGKTSLGIRHLLLGLQTTDYASDASGAAELELILSGALAQQGYDRAAITLLQRLLIRLRNPSMGMRSRPSLMLLMEHPESISLQVGTLEQNRGHYAEALSAYNDVLAADPANIEAQGRVVETLAAMGKYQTAVARASGLVVQNNAHEPTVSLLRDAFRGTGGDLAAANELGELYAANPTHRQILFAQIDLLHSLGREQQAQQALADAVAKHPDDLDLIRREFSTLSAHNDRAEAARLLIATTARHPQWTAQAIPMFDHLLRPTTSGRLQLADLRNLKLPSEQEPARQYWIARYALVWRRDGLAEDALKQSISIDPVFAPAYRLELEQLVAEDMTPTTSRMTPAALIERARSFSTNLASELHGLWLLDQHQPNDAIKAADELVAASRQNPDDAQLAFEAVIALSASGNDNRFESEMWKLVSDHPEFEPGYEAMIGYYDQHGSETMADRVLSAWLSELPDSPEALLRQATEYYHANRPEAGDAIVMQLLNSASDDPNVIGMVALEYRQFGRPENFQSQLEAIYAHDPGNFAVASELTQLYLDAHRMDDVSRVLSACRGFEAHDPDVLYSLTNLYLDIDDKAAAEDVLRQILRLDPTHAGAANDLGYFLAEAGQDLPEAERLIRKATDAEPNNASFLDSLGWVLYKQGRFAEARKYLVQATSGAADPLVLNHLGDTEYRLGDAQAATASWKRASERLLQTDDARSDLRGLQQQLQQKEIELSEKQPVDVAPIVANPTTAPATTEKTTK